MKKIKKLLSVVLMLTLTLSIIPVTEARAGETHSYTETENNDSAQYANEVTVYSGTTTITGSVCRYDSESWGLVKDEFDWYKITFDEQGRCDFKFRYNDEAVKLKDSRLKVYNADLEEMGSYVYGYAHDANETIYLRIQAQIAHSYGNYEVLLTEDTSAEYVGGNHCKTSTSYLLTEGKPAYILGWNSTYPRYVAVKVPKGKIATITLTIDPDADLNKVIRDPFHLSVIRESDSKKFLDGYEFKTDIEFSQFVSTTNEAVYDISGPDTYYFAIHGDANCQWVSIKYELKNTPTDKTKPTISGVKNGKTYTKAVTIKYKDASGIKSAKINGKSFKSGLKVSKAGSYTVTVVDKAGNKRTVKFKIKKK